MCVEGREQTASQKSGDKARRAGTCKTGGRLNMAR